MGLASLLTYYTAELVRRLGFQEFIGECTNPYSVRIMEKMGAKESNKIVYKDFEIDNVKYWEEAEEKFGCPELTMMYAELKDFKLENCKIDLDKFELVF